MDGKEYQYNQIKGDSILLKDDYKKKGKEYGIAKLTKKQISAFVEAIDLISVSPSISPKFSEKVEKFIFPRFMELNNIIYSEKSLTSEIKKISILSELLLSNINYLDVIKKRKHNYLFWSSVLNELNQSKFNQVFESESYFLMVGPVNQDIRYAILSPKNISLGMLRLHTQALIKDVKKIDNPNS